MTEKRRLRYRKPNLLEFWKLLRHQMQQIKVPPDIAEFVIRQSNEERPINVNI